MATKAKKGKGGLVFLASGIICLLASVLIYCFFETFLISLLFIASLILNFIGIFKLLSRKE